MSAWLWHETCWCDPSWSLSAFNGGQDLLDTFYHMQVRRRSTRWRRGGSSGGSQCLTMQRWSHRGRGWCWPRRNRLSSHMWTVFLWSSRAQSQWRWRRQVGQRRCWEIGWRNLLESYYYGERFHGFRSLLHQEFWHFDARYYLAMPLLVIYSNRFLKSWKTAVYNE